MESNERWLWSAKDAYFSTGDNITWNPNGPSNLKPIYSDNPYWTFYENYETDTRSRYGNVALDNKINDLSYGEILIWHLQWITRRENQCWSADVSSYSRRNSNVSEYNYDAMLNFNKDLTEKLNLEGNIGFNLRNNTRNKYLLQLTVV
jgi:hypothetical protein